MDENNTTTKKHVPNKLFLRAREERHWTQKDVADKLDLPDSRVVGRWERGLHIPQSHYRQPLCALFGKSMAELGFIKLDPDPSHDKQPDNISQSTPLWKIPPVFNSFVGRDQDVAAVCALLKRPTIRLLTLFGSGGVGKTRLSIQVATAMRSLFADGACFVSLAAITDPKLVVPTIAEALGIQESGMSSVAEQIKAMLRPKQFLLLLDNFEQVVAVALFVEELLAACPDLKVLVTSRAMLHLSAEQEFSVSPLTLPDLNQLPPPTTLLHSASVALFVQRAQTALSTFQLTPDNASAIAEICVHLDGLPLAIELAAAQVKLLPPPALLKRLPQRLQLLKSELRTLPQRHHTLYNTIKWSYDLLNEQEQWLFRQLSVFVASCTLESVEAFCTNRDQPEIDIFALLSSLLDKSLIQPLAPDESEPRYFLLESVREYGLHCLDTLNEREEAQRAHALYYLTYLERIGPQLRGPQAAIWLAVLEREQENLRLALQYFVQRQETGLALRFCEVFGNFCGLRGYWTEEWRWLNAVLDLPCPPAHIAIRAKVLRRAGHLAYRLRKLTIARTLQEESVLVSREIGDSYNLAGALSGLGRTLYRQNEIVLARQALDECVIAARASGDKWSLANSLESLAHFMHVQGYTSQAYDLLQESVTLARQLADKESLVRILTTLASVEISQCNIEQATVYAQESFTLAEELGTRPLTALALECLATIALFQGDYERAAQLCANSLAQVHDRSDSSTVVIKQLLQVTIVLAQGNSDEATIALIEQCLQFFRAQGDNPNIAETLSILADIKCSQGDAIQSMTLYKEALRLDKKGDNTRNIGKRLIGLAKAALNQSLFEQSASLFAAATSCLNPAVDLHPAQRADYEQALKHLDTLLPDPTFQLAWSKGTTMTPEQALAVLELVTSS